MPYPALLHPEPLPLQRSTADLYPTGDTQTQFCLSLSGVSVSWCTQGFACALQVSVSPVLCKFWQLYVGVNGGLLQEGLCHTQVCCTQSPCPCGRPQLTRTTTGDTQTFKDRTGSVQSLWGLLVCTKFCLSHPSVSARYGV